MSFLDPLKTPTLLTELRAGSLHLFNGNSGEDLARAIALIGRHQAVNATRERARHYAQRAIDAIAAFPASAAKAAMIEAAEFAVARRF
jgi:octaprenyl-diphosphate synthase